jgi:hypothetical protein
MGRTNVEINANEQHPVVGPALIEPFSARATHPVLLRRLIEVRQVDVTSRTYGYCKACGRPRERKGIPVFNQLKLLIGGSILWPLRDTS